MERPIKELLIILRDNARVESTWFGLKQRIGRGLCSEIAYLKRYAIITNRESCTLVNYMEDNRPSNTLVFDFWWKVRLWKPRLKWLNEQINSL